VFSTKNFHGYFEQYCSLYGAFLFCLYFEFFGSVLRPSRKVRSVVAEIRQQVLFTGRWPEMVTFEEMNQKPPEGYETLRMIVSAAQAVTRSRLISKGSNYGNKRSSEGKLVRLALKAIPAGMKAHRLKQTRGPAIEDEVSGGKINGPSDNLPTT
jgi:hypothetical protein